METRQSVTPSSLRDATPAEMRALAHPMRLRILRLCLDESLTNKELAERLGQDPGTILHHVRTLVRNGFLAADPPRRGARGSVERPYRSTGKSWQIRIRPTTAHSLSVIDAVRDEITEGGEASVVTSVRLGVRLTSDNLAELRRQLSAIGDEFVRRDDPAGEPIGVLLVAHRRPGG
jgi:DNA-binding transcriptional ArsR family regulator